MWNSSNLTASRKTFWCSSTFPALSQKRLAGDDGREEMNHEQRVLLEGKKRIKLLIYPKIFICCCILATAGNHLFLSCARAGSWVLQLVNTQRAPFIKCPSIVATTISQVWGKACSQHTTKRLKGISACLCCVMHVFLFQSNTAANTLIIPGGPSTHQPLSASLPPAAPAELTSQVSCTQIPVS